MRDLAARGMTMLVVTHEMHFARDVGDRVVFMDEGRIVEEGIPADVLDRLKEARTRQFLRRSLQLAHSLEELTMTEAEVQLEAEGGNGMKRLFAVTLVAALAAAALAAWGAAAPSGAPVPPHRRSKRRPAPAASRRGEGAKAVDHRRQMRLPAARVHHVPPRRNAGYDVDVARAFAELAFGKANRISFVCVTTPSRIPALQTKRVDIIVSTLTFTYPRLEVIDFSIPYCTATGRLLVPNASTLSLSGLAGKTVVTTRGANYATWMRNCFKDTRLLEVDGQGSAVLAAGGRPADTFMFDDGFLLGVLQPTAT